MKKPINTEIGSLHVNMGQRIVFRRTPNIRNERSLNISSDLTPLSTPAPMHFTVVVIDHSNVVAVSDVVSVVVAVVVTVGAVLVVAGVVFFLVATVVIAVSNALGKEERREKEKVKDAILLGGSLIRLFENTE